jgi:hypothetical protein
MGSGASRSGILRSGGLRQETKDRNSKRIIMKDRKPKVKSAFWRQRIVETGIVRSVCSEVSLSASDGRVWIGSSVKSFSGVEGPVSVVAFERDSILKGICDSGFRKSGLQSIFIPSSVVVLGEGSFFLCESLESVTFESGSRLERIEERAFAGSGLKSIVIPSSVVVLGKSSFYQCKSLEEVTFESGSRLERIEASAFFASDLRWIEIPSSVVILGTESFSGCKSLESVTFESGSRLERIEACAFDRTALKSIEISYSVVIYAKQIGAWPKIRIHYI